MRELTLKNYLLLLLFRVEPAIPRLIRELVTAITRREEFLLQIDILISWEQLEKLTRKD